MASGWQRQDISDEETGRPCARGQWCASATRERRDDGTWHREPATGPRAVCDADREITGACLDAIPGLHRRLVAALGEHTASEVLVRQPFGPSVPLRTDADELARLLVDVVCSWHERVAAVAPLTAPDTQRTRAAQLGRDPGSLLYPACRVLRAHLDALLALGPGPMIRPAQPVVAATVPDALVLHRGADTWLLSMTGAEAALEVTRLEWVGRAVLGETDPAPVRLLCVPCRSCGKPALERAEPPQHDGDPVFWSLCTLCGDLRTEAEYRDHLKRTAAFYRGLATPAQLAAAGLRA